ncbi:MAG: type III-B CRISPR module-associated protein Cmr5 [Candidatus Fervidibacter sp.]|uniref:type III-B CRISPR module-associated protein Cmr5 n=1 Tax=Candidatus Fervidibacter sp. TaxID=3100871 RepID=UPI00404A2535
MLSALRTLEQGRAKRAWECVQEVKSQPYASDYRTIAIKAPSLIVTNDLGQTLAFLKAKGRKEKEHETLYCHLLSWLQKQLSLDSDLLEWIIETASSQQYRFATVEALAFLRWLKCFAEAELSKTDRGE